MEDSSSFFEKDESRMSSTAYPVSPDFDEATIKEIADFEAEELAPGIVVIRNAFKINQSLVLDHIDSRAEEAHKNRWSFKEIDGVTYGINEDGFKYRMEDVPAAPVRILDPVNPNTEEEIKDFFIYLEDQIHRLLSINDWVHLVED
jgi:hypothetical protein